MRGDAVTTSIGVFSELATLRVNSNELSGLPSSLAECTNLTELSLQVRSSDVVMTRRVPRSRGCLPSQRRVKRSYAARFQSNYYAVLPPFIGKLER